MLTDLLTIYLPIAQVELNILYLILAGVFVGVVSGIFGLGGSIILVPTLTFFGVPMVVAVSTVSNLMTASSFSGYIAYARRNRVDYILATLLLIGGVAGTFLGIIIFNFLSIIGNVDLIISLIFIVILSAVGGVTVWDSVMIIMRKFRPEVSPPLAQYKEPWIRLPYQINIPSSKASLSIFSPIFLGILGGVLVTLTGIGGSLIMVPAMIYVLKISDAFTTGTTHFQLIFTSIFATILHSISNHSLDVVLALILIVGNVWGVQMGVKFAGKFKPDHYRIVFALIIMGLCVKVMLNLFATPSSLYSMEIID
jgi:uncharacterized membrane protein YfcA